jgi:hypothetical protein
MSTVMKLIKALLMMLGLTATLSGLFNPGPKLGHWLFKRNVMIVWIVLIIASGITYLWIAFNGPHMHDQPSIKTYEKVLSPLPDGVQPVDESPLWNYLDTNSEIPKRDKLSDGKIYYNYYCNFCHGEPGGPVGPVGRSFIPPPPNLLAERTLSQPDSVLADKMVTGCSHVPLLPYIVPPESRLPIAQYIKSFHFRPAE